jgi:hypothetical protein
MSPSFFEEGRVLVEGELNFWKAQVETLTQRHLADGEQVAAQVRTRLDDAGKLVAEAVKHQLAFADKAMAMYTQALGTLTPRA